MTDGGGFKEYVRVCTTDLCNDWDGISSRHNCGSGGDDGGPTAAVVLEIVGVVIALMVPAMTSD